jgi:hypothetical protein
MPGVRIKRISDTVFKVSGYSKAEYKISFTGGISLCTCKDFLYRQLPKNGICKHIREVIKEYPEVLDFHPTGTMKPKLLSDIMQEREV